MRYYIGVDWADKQHAVVTLDETGARVDRRVVHETVDAFVEWGRWLEEQRATGHEVWAAIERPDGRVVDFLLDHGVVVYALNPAALEQVRGRFRQSGSKSDPLDAEVAANFLRTDHLRLHPLRPASADAQELKGLTRDYARQVQQQTRVLNQLTVTLKEYYPRALELCSDLTSRWARDFLEAYPTPAAAQALTERAWTRWARGHRLTAERAAALWAVLAAPQLPVPAHVVRIGQRRLTVLLAQLEVSVQAVATYREVVTDFFAAWPAARWATTLPGGRSGITIPTLVAELGDAVGRWASAQHLQAQGGMVPVTEASGRHRAVRYRTACNRFLRAAAHQMAFVSLRHSEWAHRYYQRSRARGHTHHHAVRALGAKWLKIIFVLWRDQRPYDEQYHLASMARHALRQPA